MGLPPLGKKEAHAVLAPRPNHIPLCNARGPGTARARCTRQVCTHPNTRLFMNCHEKSTENSDRVTKHYASTNLNM